MMRKKLLFIALIFCSFNLIGQEMTPKLETLNGIKNIDFDPNSLYEDISVRRSTIVDLPFDKIGLSEFTIEEDIILSEKLTKEYPDIRTYKIKSTKNSEIKGGLVVAPGFTTATIYTDQGITSIYPSDGQYVIEQGIENEERAHEKCGHHSYDTQEQALLKEMNQMAQQRVQFSNGDIKRTYRLAIVTTGEYYELNGANTGMVQTVMTAAVMSLNVLYENELAVRFQISDSRIYTDKTTDPFDETSDNNRVEQAQAGVDLNFGVNTYDIGQVFHRSTSDDGWGTGGVAFLGVVCNSSENAFGPRKAGGWSGSFVPGNSFLGIVAHEIAHMFSATHTFNGTGGSCTDAISATSAYEIGSGTTLMSYQGICDDDQNIPAAGPTDNNYFHAHSLFQMVTYINAFGDCASEVPLDNSAPQVNANPCGTDVRIPKNTPFYLNGSGIDNENTGLTFTWEQYDEDGAGTSTQGKIGQAIANSAIAPLFRSFPPSMSTERYFPTLAAISEGVTSDPFQVLPTVGRTLNFQLTARDNNEEGGGIGSDELEVSVEPSGPLSIQNLNSLDVGSTQTITWSTGNSDDLCSKAKLLLSVDGGLTFPFTLVDDVDYASGTADFMLSESFPATSIGRIMIMCDDSECYSFFDISNNPITISSSCNVGPSIICGNTDFEIFDQGSASLQLPLSHINGGEINSITETVVDDPTTVVTAVSADTGGGCSEAALPRSTKAVAISVDTDGEYTFAIENFNSDGGRLYSIHTASDYDRSDPCGSIVGSSLEGGSFSSVLRSDLLSCEEYLLVLYVNSDSYPLQANVSNISGPGKVYSGVSNPDFSNTFIAVNENGIIERFSDNADFTALSGGLYEIYTVNYKSGGGTPPANSDPSTWLGQTLASVQSNECMLLSSNNKSISVDFSCRVNTITAGTQTACDEISNLYSQDITVTYEDAPATGKLRVNGVEFDITGSPQTVTLTAQISDGQPVGVNASFTDMTSCELFVADLFTAPELCCGIELDLGGDQVLCDDQQIILDAGDDGVEYKWFKDGGELMGETSSTYEVTSSGNYLVEVIKSPTCSTTDLVSITLFPTPTVILETDELTVCEGEIRSIQSETTAANLQWFKDGVALAGETTSSLLITEAGQYHLDGLNEFTLSSGEILGCMSSDTINVTYVPRPIVDLGLDQEFCEGEAAYVLNAGQDGTEYTWSRNGVVIPAENGDMLSVDQSGLYTVIVDKGGGCDAKDTVSVVFVELAEVFAGTDINVCSGQSANLATFIEAESFEWFFNGSLFSDQSENPEVTQGGEYILVGLNAANCESRDTVVVTEVSPPMIDLGEDKVGCIGSSIFLSVDSVGMLMWRKDNVFFSTNASIEITEAGTYTIAVQAANNCLGTDEISVTFEPGPTLGLGDDQSFCMGEDYTINADTNGDNIKWFRDGVEIFGEVGFALVVNEAGVYSAVVEGTTGCSVEEQVEITVNEVPDLVLDEDVVICDGESATLSTDTPADSYEWTLNGSVVSNDPEFMTTTAGEYTLTVVNEFGCSDSDMITVNANAAPDLTIDAIHQFCEGSDVTITAEGNGDSFQWILDGTEITGETSNTITLNSSGNLVVIASSVDGCTSMVFTEVSSSTAPVVELGEDQSLCPGQTAVLNSGNHTTYAWSNGSNTPTININSNVDELTTEIYTVTVTNMAGCESTDEVSITLFPRVNASIDQSATGVCNGEPVMLTASGGTNYQWIDDSGTLMDIDGPNATASPVETTTYQVIVMDDCPGNEDSETVVIEVFEAGLDIDAGEDDCAVNGKTLELNASGGVAYSWLSDPTIDSGADSANPIVSPTEETIYFVDITDSNGCIFRDSVTICVTDDPLEFFQLVTIITPNGDGDNDALSFNGLEAFPDNTLTVYNRWGYAVFEKRGYQNDNILWTGENGGDVLPVDTYYYVLEFNGEVYKSPITIMR